MDSSPITVSLFPKWTLPRPADAKSLLVTAGRQVAYQQRLVAVTVDIRMMALEGSGMYLTRKGMLAVRDPVALGYIRSAFFVDTEALLYLRPWSYDDSEVRQDNRSFNVSKTSAGYVDTATIKGVKSIACFTPVPAGTFVCLGCLLPIYYPERIPLLDWAPRWASPRAAEMGEVPLRCVTPKPWGALEQMWAAMLCVGLNPAEDIWSAVVSGTRLPVFFVPDPTTGNQPPVHLAYEALRKAATGAGDVEMWYVAEKSCESWFAVHRFRGAPL